MNRLFTEILDALAQTPEQKEHLAISRDEEHVRKLLHLELTRRDWEKVKGRKDSVAMDPVVERLRREPELGRALAHGTWGPAGQGQAVVVVEAG